MRNHKHPVMNLFKTIYGAILLMILSKILEIDADGSYTFANLVRFPYSDFAGPFIGIFVAIAFALEPPYHDVTFSINLEGNYVLPMNDTEFTYPPVVSRRSWQRQFFYNILESNIKSHGYSGRSCLLRAICEASLYSLEHTGILGDLLHIILTPSTSNDETPHLLNDYSKAEEMGKIKQNCKKYQKKCSISLLDLISVVGKIFDGFMGH